MNDFKLIGGLAEKDFIIDLTLSRVLFEDNKLYPWVFLVPMKSNVKNMSYLSSQDRLQLMKEMEIVEKVMISLFKPDQTNVAAIGNKTPQLHIHIICRKIDDPDWPNTVWGNHSERYDENEKKETILKIRNAIELEINKFVK
ncbi:MAG: HIT family protein [Rickettsiales bacterium]|jgi:diadenosine tetraphosphate (Ap4A) HIT family hydrolase|nr:HIT family protein [Rickettsiales bacterium]